MKKWHKIAIKKIKDPRIKTKQRIVFASKQTQSAWNPLVKEFICTETFFALICSLRGLTLKSKINYVGQQ